MTALDTAVVQILTIIEPVTTIVTESDPVTTVVTEGIQGPPGPPGQIGPASGSAFTRTSAAPISALVVVWEDALGSVLPLDYRDAAHIDLLVGITLTAATAAGQSVTVQRSGVLDAAGLGLTVERVWLGVNGALTQTPPTDGFDVLAGFATADQRLFVDFTDGIQLD